MGHLKNYAVGDAVAHFHRRTGRRVLHPMGYDAFGLPAENHAIKTGEHPRDSTAASIAQFQKQFREWGISIDWSREFATSRAALLPLDAVDLPAPVRARPGLPQGGRGQLVPEGRDGARQRAGHRRPLRALRHARSRRASSSSGSSASPTTPTGCSTTWPTSTGPSTWSRCSATGSAAPRAPRSRSAARRSSATTPVFTTRPDTLFGATFFVMAPGAPGRAAAGRGHRARGGGAAPTSTARSPRTARSAATSTARRRASRSAARSTNPVNGEQIPMFVADYVLMEYGTGAIMAVPAHDERDFAFATKYGLPIREVVDERRASCRTRPPARWSTPAEFDGKDNREALAEIVDWLDREGRGHRSINYRLRDWLLSRQRYWGCPIPIVHCDACGLVPVPDDQLPVLLPDVTDYQPKGRSPLAAAEDWVRHDVPEVRRARAARDGHDGHVRRLVLVLPALLRRQQRRGGVGPGGPGPLGAGRPVHRRRRARHPAPALRALLRQGARRHGLPGRAGAVPARSSRRG